MFDSSSSEIPLTTTIPTSAQVPYTPPTLPTLLSLSTYLVLLALPTLLSNSFPVSTHTSSFQDVHLASEPDDGVVTASDSISSTKSSAKASYTLNPALTLLFPLLLGALLGPSITSASIPSTSTQRTLIDIGYLGLLLLIFEAGVSLDAASLKLMRDNAGLSSVSALTGVLLPVALSMGLGMGAYGYTGLQAFACGASLSSTSLGTTLALLAPGPATTAKSDSGREKEKKTGNFTDMDLRRTRVGCVLVCAALLDDVLGLVVAGIITGLAQAESGGGANIQWPTIVRPILVSIAFGSGTPVVAMGLRKAVRLHWRDVWKKVQKHLGLSRRGSLLDLSSTSTSITVAIPQPPVRTTTQCQLSPTTPRPQFFLVAIVLTLMAFVAGSGYAGTSELFGAYLAGALVGYIFGEEDVADGGEDKPSGEISGVNDAIIAPPTQATDQDNAGAKIQTIKSSRNPAHDAFVAYLQPLLTHLLGPLFFASIGAALPVKAMFATHPNAVQIVIINNTFTSSGTGDATVIQGKASHQVVWRGLVYALLMVLAKMAVGVWMLVWPEPKDTMRGRGLARKGVDGAKDANVEDGVEDKRRGGNTFASMSKAWLEKLRWSLWAAHRAHNRGRNSEYTDEGGYGWNASKTKERGHDGDEEIGKGLFGPMPDLNASSELKLESKVNINVQESLAEDTTCRPRQLEHGYGEERAMVSDPERERGRVDDHTEASLSPASMTTTPSSSSPPSPFRRQSRPLINVVPRQRHLHPDRVNQQGPKQASPSSSTDKNINHDIENHPASSTPNEPTRLRSALLLGLAMVARGEIALIIAQLSRPLLLGPTPVSTTSTSTSDAGVTTTTITTRIADEEPFAIVIWAILVSTVGGALGVGALVGSWKRRDEQKA